MLRQLRNVFLLLIIGFFSFSSSIYADNYKTIYQDQSKVISQQITLLKDRLFQAKNQLETLQKQQATLLNTLTIDQVSKQLLNQTAFDIEAAKSNLESLNIELSESQQSAIRLEKDSQAIENQLNIFNMFGLKILRHDAPDISRLQQELIYQKNLLQLEKTRASNLIKLQEIAVRLLQVYQSKYMRIDTLLKSQTITHLKEQQAQSEVGLLQQQGVWLQRLNTLNAELNHLQKSPYDKVTYEKLQSNIFFVNENVNFTYIEMLIARYAEQIQQLKVSISHTNSITLLNKTSDEVQVITKQLVRVKNLLKERMTILGKRETFYVGSFQWKNLETQYTAAVNHVASLNQQLISFRATLDRALQQELSARQGLPGFGTNAWVDFGSEILLVPALTFQVIKSLSHTVMNAFAEMSKLGWAVLFALEMGWIMLFISFNYSLRRIVTGMPDHEFGHINLKWLTIKLLHRNLVDIAFIGNGLWLFSLLNIPPQNFNFLTHLAFVWLIFKMMIMTARLCLVETVHDRAGHDVRLYYRLKWLLLIGGFITALTVFIRQLPMIYEVKDLFDRLFLLFLLVASIVLLRQWELVPGLILPHIDASRTYLKRVVLLLGLLIPAILLINSIVGLLGFVNLIFTISWYESIFILVLVSYLLIRGLLNDAMELVSQILIRYVTNGWLVTEAFLKPIDRLLRIILFLSGWIILFLLYGWDQQSPVVERLTRLLNYHLVDILNTSITPWNIIEVTVTVSFLYWAARWTREFMYRFLLSRNKDIGLRNSIAILSQYGMIVLGVFVSLRLLGIDFRALTFVATAFAFGVGLGLRDLVNNFACGFLMLIERPVRVGDMVTINGYEGEVTNIGGRAITIRTWDHMDLLVPNAELYSKSFTNWTGKDNNIRTVISIKVNRNDNPDKVQDIIYQVLNLQKEVLSDPPCEVFLKELNDGMIEFEVRYFINLRQVKSRMGVRSEVLVAIWNAFESHGIKAPYPHHEIYLKEGLPVFTP